MGEMKQLCLFEKASVKGCTDCLCKDCLKWWQCRCPYGECYDDYRAKIDPYDLAHPNTPPRTQWTHWKEEQSYWCRGGITHPQCVCGDYVPYSGSSVVKTCLDANVQIFQDGYILCSIVENTGCEQCYERFKSKNDIGDDET